MSKICNLACLLLISIPCAVLAQSASNFDVAGVKLGMNKSQVVENIKKFNPILKIKSFAKSRAGFRSIADFEYEVLRVSCTDDPENTFSAKVKDVAGCDNNESYIFVVGNISGKVFDMSRYSAGNSFKQSDLIQSLIKKYNIPSGAMRIEKKYYFGSAWVLLTDGSFKLMSGGYCEDNYDSYFSVKASPMEIEGKYIDLNRTFDIDAHSCKIAREETMLVEAKEESERIKKIKKLENSATSIPKF